MELRNFEDLRRLACAKLGSLHDYGVGTQSEKDLKTKWQSKQRCDLTALQVGARSDEVGKPVKS